MSGITGKLPKITIIVQMKIVPIIAIIVTMTRTVVIVIVFPICWNNMFFKFIP